MASQALARNTGNGVADLPQYSLGKTLLVWAAAAGPMAALGWFVTPALAHDPDNPGFARLAILAIGLIWQFILVVMLLYRETGSLRWSGVQHRLWLNTPRLPQSGERRRLWWWACPAPRIGSAVRLAGQRNLEQVLGFDLSLSLPTTRPRLRYLPQFARCQGATGRQLESVGAVCDERSVQHGAGRRTVVSRIAAAAHGGCLRKMGLGNERALVWPVSPPSALGHAGFSNGGDAALCPAKPIFSQRLVWHHCPLRAEHLPDFSHPGTGARAGVDDVPGDHLNILVAVGVSFRNSCARL